MNSIIGRLPGIASVLFFAPYYIWRNIKVRYLTLLLVTTIALSGCFLHFFRAVDSKTVDAATIHRLQNANKYFIMHFRNKVTGLTNMNVSGDKLEADLIPLPARHSQQLNPAMNRPNQVKLKEKPNVLMEVHLYSLDTVSEGQTHMSLPLTDFNGMDVYEFDAKATRSNHVWSVVGPLIGIAFAAVIIASAGTPAYVAPAATNCNCPQVYVNTNGQYEFRSGVYSGAIHSGLERTDYLALTGITPINNKYQFRIGNVPNEEQFINQVQLMKVEHPAGVEVLADRKGKILTYGNTISPFNATYDDGTDISAQLKFTDGEYYFFDSKPNSNGFSDVTMRFNKPGNANKGKLLVHAGNSAWAGYLFHEFESLFGNSFEKWRSQQEKDGSPNASQWPIDQGLPMKVFVETEKGWEYVDHFALTGNTASRDMIMEIDLSRIKKDIVNVRIESAYQFWNLDMVAMDFSDNQIVTTTVIDPVKVVKNDQEDNRSQLSQKDKKYSHLLNNDYINFEYDATSSATDKNSFFLVSTGYYHTNPPKGGKMDLRALLKFKKKGAFDRLSRSKFAVLQQVFVKAGN